MTDLKIEYMSVEDLVPHERNPKFHDLDAIRESYERFGYAEAVVKDDRTGKLAAGHGRCQVLIALKVAGEPAPENIKVVKGKWLVPVQVGWSSKDDDEAAAFLIAANRITEIGGWDNRGTVSILTSLESLSGTGWTPKELDRMLAKLDPIAPLEFDVIDPEGMHLTHKCPKCGFEWDGSQAK